jgi:hypothetical protein
VIRQAVHIDAEVGPGVERQQESRCEEMSLHSTDFRQKKSGPVGPDFDNARRPSWP